MGNIGRNVVLMFVRLRYYFVVASATMLGSCAVNVQTIYDHEADFARYKTFCWMQGCELKVAEPHLLEDSLLRENTKKAIVAELKNKGLTLDTNNPDLLVGFTVTIKDEKAIVYHQADDTPFYRPLENDRKEINYQKGTLVLGLVDKKESKVVWEAFAVRYMDERPDFSEKRVLKGIQLVLKRFPPAKN